MTLRSSVCCVNEPFLEAFSLGPERMTTRYEEMGDPRIETYKEWRYKDVVDRLEEMIEKVSGFPASPFKASFRSIFSHCTNVNS